MQLEGYYYVHSRLPIVPILSHINAVNNVPVSSRSILISDSHLSLVFQVVLSLRFPHGNPVCTSPLPHMPYPSHYSWFDHPYTISSATKISQLLILHFPPVSCHLIPFTRWFKYDRDKLWLIYTQIVLVIFEPPCTSIHLPRHPVLEHPQRIFLLSYLTITVCQHIYPSSKFCPSLVRYPPNTSFSNVHSLMCVPYK
jgi:hypothetical protein